MKYPIGTIARMVGERPNSTWININGSTQYRCIETSNEDVYPVGYETYWQTDNYTMWDIELPKERLFSKLYLTLKS